MADPEPVHPDPSEANALADDCRRCPALVECRTRISWGVGPTDASLVVVGEAPGAGDPTRERWQGGNHSGMAYTAAASGRKVRSLVRDVGYSGDAYYTNAVKCFPCDGEGSNREPTAEERANCRPYLVGEVESVAPDCVLATGKHATQSLFAVGGRSLDGFLDSVLEPTHVDGIAPPVVPLVHPSYQEVWIPRLGYDYEGYVAALGETLADL
jgi:DNA polymerase